MGNLHPTEEQVARFKEANQKANQKAEQMADAVATKAAASKYTSVIFLVAIILLLGIGASVPLWFD